MYYILKNKQPELTDFKTWTEFISQPEQLVIASTSIAFRWHGHLMVSVHVGTIFTGVEANFLIKGLFETQIMDGVRAGPILGASTWHDAIVNHELSVERTISQYKCISAKLKENLARVMPCSPETLTAEIKQTIY